MAGAGAEGRHPPPRLQALLHGAGTGGRLGNGECCTTAAGSWSWLRDPVDRPPTQPSANRGLTPFAALKLRAWHRFFRRGRSGLRRCSRRGRSGRSRPPGSAPARRRCRAPARVSRPNAGADRPRLHSGSSRWASKPAETIRSPRVEVAKRRQRLVLERVHERRAPTSRPASGMLTVAPSPAPPPRSARLPGPRVERVLVERDVEHVGSSQKMAWVPLPWWASQSSTATRSTPAAPGVPRRDGGVVHQAEAHRPGRLGMVARRPAAGRTRPRGRRPARRRPPRSPRPTRPPRRRSSARSRPCRGRSALLPARPSSRMPARNSGGWTRSRSSVRRRRRAPRPARAWPARRA